MGGQWRSKEQSVEQQVQVFFGAANSLAGGLKRPTTCSTALSSPLAPFAPKPTHHTLEDSKVLVLCNARRAWQHAIVSNVSVPTAKRVGHVELLAGALLHHRHRARNKDVCQRDGLLGVAPLECGVGLAVAEELCDVFVRACE